MNSFLVDAVHRIHQASMDKRALARGGDGVEGEGGAEVGDGGGERALRDLLLDGVSNELLYMSVCVCVLCVCICRCLCI